ncbi:MAG: alpha-glucosidase [Oscillospiraceae bacterium]|nr:alpha-glucosidase [Oscillospiraceae bacterium]
MKKRWWNDKIAYQIYPKSFCDSNGDGIGDLAGILSKLDYLKELGVDIIWLSPIYRSPFVDQGYDIADYYAIAEEFGTMEEFDTLLAETKRRGMYLIMDLVVNHCSDQHQWFQKALADPDGEYAQRFWFVKGKDGNPPSNYRSYFGGSAWEQVPGTEDRYYLHMFAKEQPDLNWENPVVREKIFNMVNWWLDKGLAGFRIDAIINIKKIPTFPSYAPDGPDGLASCVHMVHEAQGVGALLKELKEKTFDRCGAFTVGEVFDMKPQELVDFVGEDGYFSSMFDFSAHELTFGEHGWYDSKPISFRPWRDTIFASQKKMLGVGFLSNIIENHDEPRGASRYLPSYAQNEMGKKLLATTYLLLRGIPFLYQGQEIGMTNCRRSDISEYDDISTRDQYRWALEAGCTKEQALQCCYENSRDNSRTPMQWSDAPNAGFTTGKPWLAVNPNYREINVAEQESRPDSVLNYYRKLIALRKNDAFRETFTYGALAPILEEEPFIFAYIRENQESGQRILVIGNYGDAPRTLSIGGMRELLLSNCGREEVKGGTLTLAPCESAVILLWA